MSKITVGELKKAMENVPDNVIVELESDSGVEDGYDGSIAIIEKAYRVNYKLKDGEKIEDGSNEVDKFVIYANYRDESETEEE